MVAANAKSDVCDIYCVDEASVSRVRAEMLDETVSRRLAEIFDALGDPTRVRIIYALLKAELCVCDLSALLGASQSAISHQLRILRNLRLVKFRREGKIIFYSLDDNHIERLVSDGLAHVEES
jgi:ArsR family transcriptional regulator